MLGMPEKQPMGFQVTRGSSGLLVPKIWLFIIFFNSFVGHGRCWLASIYCPSLVALETEWLAGPFQRAVESQALCCGSGVTRRPDQVRTAGFPPYRTLVNQMGVSNNQ